MQRSVTALLSKVLVFVRFRWQQFIKCSAELSKTQSFIGHTSQCIGLSG